MGLYQKYRPQTFEEVVGQPKAVASLAAMIGGGEPPHAMLFHGPSGTGKTTLARVTARALGCDPIDFVELDAADFRGIDTVREMRRNMAFKPRRGTCRVWLMDECHALTKDAQNAVLKALEDTPAHVYLMLATTEPGRLLATIRSRCSAFQTELVSPKDIAMNVLWPIVRAEGKSVGKDTLKVIAARSNGNVRSAVVMLEAVIDLPAEEQAAAAQTVMDQEAQVKELCQALLKRAPWQDVSAILRRLEDDPENCRLAVLGYMSAVILNSPQITTTSVRAFEVSTCFGLNYYDTKKNGLTLSAFQACNLPE